MVGSFSLDIPGTGPNFYAKEVKSTDQLMLEYMEVLISVFMTVADGALYYQWHTEGDRVYPN